MSNESPENLPENRARIRKEIEAALAEGTTEALVEVVVAECVELRERIAERIIEPLVGRYPEGLSNDRLDTLAYFVLMHREDPMTGEIEWTNPPQRKGLSRIT